MTGFALSIVAIALAQICLVASTLTADYESKTAAVKQAILWNQCLWEPYPSTALPTSIHTPLQLVQVLNATFLEGSFTHESDEIQVGRPKVIHTFGTCAKARFVAFTNHTYTGLYQTGATGIIRLSVVNYEVDNLIPSFGFKALINGKPSKNFHMLYSPDGQGLNKNYFQNVASNIIPDSKKPPLIRVAQAFTEALLLMGPLAPSLGSRNRPIDPNTMPLYEHSTIKADGSHVILGFRKAPYRIDAVPNPAIGYNTTETTEFRNKLAESVAIGSKLYTFVAYPTKEQGISKTGGQIIGYIVTESKFVASKYCDETLFFNHASKPYF